MLLCSVLSPIYGTFTLMDVNLKQINLKINVISILAKNAVVDYL
jgi:hypothetical protein